MLLNLGRSATLHLSRVSILSSLRLQSLHPALPLTLTSCLNLTRTLHNNASNSPESLTLDSVSTHFFSTREMADELGGTSKPFSSFSVLHSCEDLQTLKQVHASLIVSTGFEPISVASKLISLYAQFNDLDSAVSVFKAVQDPNTAVWNLIIKAHVDLGLAELAFCLYKQMRELGVTHDSFTFPIINRMVGSLRNSLLCGEVVHCLAIKMGFEPDIYFCNTMIVVYMKCGCLAYAHQMFDEMAHRDLVSWTSMISGYVCQRNVVGAFLLFREMQMELEPNSVTVMVMLQACCNSNGSVIQGRQLHGYVIKNGCLIDRSVQNSVLRMYSSTGSWDDAEILFRQIDKRDGVSWNIMMFCYSLSCELTKMADCFHEMRNEVLPSIETLTLLISVFAEGANLFQGFIQNGHFEEAIELFQQMLAAGVEPEAKILGSLLVAYTHLGALQLGKGIHGYLIRNLFYDTEEDNTLETSILNMYIRCGNISSAIICFDRMVDRDVVTWTSMIEGCGIHGLGFEAVILLHQMVEEGIVPNSVTFLGLLSACSHSGLLSEGSEVFYSMKWRFGIEPDLNHCTCMVDLLGRSGKLKEALAIIVKLVSFPDSRIWGALLAASRVYGDQKLGEYAAQKLLELEPDNAGYYTLLSNIQASVGRWAGVEEIRSAMKDKDLIKKPGWSCIESKGLLHAFVSGDRSHPCVVEINEILGYLSRKMQDLQYVLYS
ncbi:hypothetical protein F0562_015530 [Nyssa sinensis]|uniref:Uncharacterized protein n=1 Tax=Nyssa sinensis TaxID=561372 RepID=A0A5J4ZHJ3_9ASTE|nr:hypothetical protein F0562_015530 [Nyssa sinensis]